MNESTVAICFDCILGPELMPLAIERARAENADNAPGLEATALTRRLFRPGRTLRVAFLEGNDRLRNKVIHYASQWTEYANLHFSFGSEDPDAEIRIMFDPTLGNWSYIGTDNLAIPAGTRTMNFGELAHNPPENRYASVILHEFGHALGLVHEHQSPAGGIPWNRAAVIADLSRPPNRWNLDQIEFNMFIRYDYTHTQYAELLPVGTDFDPQSIMIYRIPPHWTLDHREYSENTTLSALDKAFIARCYPR